MSKSTTTYGSGCQLEQYLCSLDNNDDNNDNNNNNDNDPNNDKDNNVRKEFNYSKLFITIIIDIIMNSIYKLPTLQCCQQYNQQYYHIYDDTEKYNYVLIKFIIIPIILIVVTSLVIIVKSKLLVLILILLISLISIPYIISYYCTNIITKLMNAYNAIDTKTNELIVILKKLLLINMGKALTQPLPFIYQEEVIESKNLSFKELRNKMYTLMTNTIIHLININNDIDSYINCKQQHQSITRVYSDNTIVTSKLLRFLRDEMLLSISSTITKVINIIDIKSSNILYYDVIQRLFTFVYYIHQMDILIERHQIGLESIFHTYIKKSNNMDQFDSNINTNIKSQLFAVRLKAETIMYNAFAVEHNLALNSLHNITHKSIETKQKLESLLTIIDDLQLSDIPKLREDIKQFLVSINDTSCDNSHNINNKKKNNDNSDQVYVANDISINNDMNGFSYNNNNNNEIIETIDNNNNDIIHDTVSNENNIVDVYVATIPRHHDGRKNDTIDNDNNINTNNYNNIILMNELNNALQLISFTERINKFDDDNNQNYDNNDKNDNDNDDDDNDNDNNNNDSYTNENTNDIKRELPLQLNTFVTFDLQRRLSEMNKSNTCNTIHE